MGQDVDERGLRIIHRPWQPGYLCAGSEDKELARDNGHKGRGEVEPVLRRERKGTRLSSAGALEEIQFLKAACFGISLP